MNGVSAQAIARIYREVLIESFGAARVVAAVVDRNAQSAIEDAFDTAIPSIVPAQFAGQFESPALRAALKSNAARSIVGICERMPFPRGEFVTAVVLAAQRQG
jgi:hypothetical protein